MPSPNIVQHVNLEKYQDAMNGLVGRGYALLHAIAVARVKARGITWMWSSDCCSVWMKDKDGAVLRQRHGVLVAMDLSEGAMAFEYAQKAHLLVDPPLPASSLSVLSRWDRDFPQPEAEVTPCCAHRAHWAWAHVASVGRWYLVPYAYGDNYYEKEPCPRCFRLFLYVNGFSEEDNPLLALKRTSTSIKGGMALCRYAQALRLMVCDRNDELMGGARYWTDRLHAAAQTDRLQWAFHEGRNDWYITAESDLNALRFVVYKPGLADSGEIHRLGGLSVKESGPCSAIDALLVERNLTVDNFKCLAPLWERIHKRVLAAEGEKVPDSCAPASPAPPTTPEGMSVEEARFDTIAQRMDVLERRMGASRTTFRQVRTSLEGRIAQLERELADVRKGLTRSVAKTRMVDERLGHVSAGLRGKVTEQQRSHTLLAQDLALVQEDARLMREAMRTITAHAYNKGEPLESRIALIINELNGAGFEEPDDD